MEETITELIKKSKVGDEKSTLELLNRFKGLIKKYSYKTLFSEDMVSVLNCHLIYVIKIMPILSEGENINYIRTAIKNSYLNTINKESQYTYTHIYTNDFLETGNCDNDEIIFKEILSKLDLTKKNEVTPKS